VNPEQLRFAKTHEWVYVEADSQGRKVGTVGVSSFAVEALTDLVFMQLPEVGRQVKPGQSVGEIESVKAVSDLYSPVGGKVVAVNTELTNHLETLSTDPYGAGWMVKIQLDDPKQLDELMDFATYQAQCAEEGH
jgi:glycine cleavage system H protein